jgi:hypothetical protein
MEVEAETEALLVWVDVAEVVRDPETEWVAELVSEVDSVADWELDGDVDALVEAEVDTVADWVADGDVDALVEAEVDTVVDCELDVDVVCVLVWVQDPRVLLSDRLVDKECGTDGEPPEGDSVALSARETDAVCVDVLDTEFSVELTSSENDIFSDIVLVGRTETVSVDVRDHDGVILCIHLAPLNNGLHRHPQVAGQYPVAVCVPMGSHPKSLLMQASLWQM